MKEVYGLDLTELTGKQFVTGLHQDRIYWEFMLFNLCLKLCRRPMFCVI